MSGERQELVFVYNAGSTAGARAVDLLHKAISPGTYACNLCRVTYGVFAKKKEWRRFLDSLALSVTFSYRDEFAKSFPSLAGAPLPAVFLRGESGRMELLAGAEEINRARTVDDLKAILAAKLGL